MHFNHNQEHVLFIRSISTKLFLFCANNQYEYTVYPYENKLLLNIILFIHFDIRDTVKRREILSSASLHHNLGMRAEYYIRYKARNVTLETI